MIKQLNTFQDYGMCLHMHAPLANEMHLYTLNT